MNLSPSKKMAVDSQFCPESVGLPLYGSQDWVVESAFRFNNPMQNQRQWNQSQSFESSFFVPHFRSDQITVPDQNRNPLMAISVSIAAQVEKQGQDIDRHIRLQNERLKISVQEEMKRGLVGLMKKLELETRALLGQKDAEIAQAFRRTMDLEELLRKLEAENQIRQREAREYEAKVLALKSTLLQVKDRTSNHFINGADNAESCCESNRVENKRREKVNGEEERETEMETEMEMEMAMGCRGCHFRISSVLFLPCRHLCLCKYCDSVVEFCPVCQTPKMASIEALL